MESFAADLKKLRFPVLFSFAAGLFISVVFDEAFHIGWGACFSPDDFLRAGSFMYERTRRENQEYSACTLPPPSWPPRLYHPSCCPTAFGMSVLLMNRWGCPPAQGIGYRALFYLIAILMIGALINLFPDRENIFSQVGTNAILVYAGSSFAAPALYLLIAKFFACRQCLGKPGWYVGLCSSAGIILLDGMDPKII